MNDTATLEAPVCGHSRELLESLLVTSPVLSWHSICTTFSVVNDFLFLPPPPSYTLHSSQSFSLDSDINCERLHIPWQHVLPVDGKRIGPCTGYPFVGRYITCTLLTHKGGVDPLWRPARRRSEADVSAVGDDNSGGVYGGSPQHVAPAAAPQLREPDDEVRTAIPTTASCFNDIQQHTQNSSPLRSSGQKRKAVDHRKLAFFFHGNAADCGPDALRMPASLLRRLPPQSQCVVVEYPGYGTARGTASESTVNLTTERVLQYFFAVVPTLLPRHLVLAAHSIGCAVAVHALDVVTRAFAAKLPVAGSSSPLSAAGQDLEDGEQNYVSSVLLVSPFTSVRSVVKDASDAAAIWGDDTVTVPVARMAESALLWTRADAIVNGVAAWEDALEDCARALASRRVRLDTAASCDETCVEHEERPLPFIYRLGGVTIADRFQSSSVLRALQENFDCFRHTSMLLVHGVQDAVIPHTHAVRLCSAIYCGDRELRKKRHAWSAANGYGCHMADAWRADCEHKQSHQQQHVSSSDCPTTLPTLRVWLWLSSADDHDTIADVCNRRLFCSAARSIFGFSSNSTTGSPLIDTTSAVDGGKSLPTVSVAHAVSDFAAWDRQVAWQRYLSVACLLALALWVLALGGVYLHLHSSTSSGSAPGVDDAVMVWVAVEGFVLCCVAVLTALVPWCGLRQVRKSDGDRPSGRQMFCYIALRCVTYVTAVAAGMLLGSSCALSAEVCPALRAHSQSSHGWLAVSQRATMLAVAGGHTAHLVWSLVTNR